MAVIEYIKRNQKMGYDGDQLVYKVPVTSETPVVEEELPLEPEVSSEDV